MAVPVHKSHVPETPARIGVCEAEFDVGALNGPLSSPEKLLAAVRQEILPALSEVLDDPDMAALEIDAPLVEIDLGTWPDDPTWSEVRFVLALKLRQALEAYGQVPKSAERGTQRSSPEGDFTTAPHQRPDAANKAADGPPSTRSSHDETLHPPQSLKGDHPPSTEITTQRQDRLDDPAPAQALSAFLGWLETQGQTQGTAEILIHLAERPGLQQALQLWRAADPQARRAVLPLSERQEQAVLSAAERIAPQQMQSRLQPKAAEKPSGDPVPPVRRTPQTSSAPEAAPDRLARVRQLLATGSTPEAERLRATAHWLATQLHGSGASTEMARDNAVRLIARLHSNPDLAKALSTRPAPAVPTSPNERAGDPQQVQPALTSGNAPPESLRESQTPVEEERNADPLAEASGQIDPALRALAAALTPKGEQMPDDPQALWQSVLQKFTQRPAQVFQTAEAIDHLPALANALRLREVARAVLTGPGALSTRQISTLHAARPTVMPAVLATMASNDIRQIVDHLLPGDADLLRAQIADLQEQAQHPQHALQLVVLALLEKRALDVEGFRSAEPSDPDGPTQNADADRSHPSEAPPPVDQMAEATGNRPAQDRRGLRPASPAEGHQAQSTPVTILRALLSLSGLTEREIDRVNTLAAPAPKDESRPQRENTSEPSPATTAQDGSLPDQSERSEAKPGRDLTKRATATPQTRDETASDPDGAAQATPGPVPTRHQPLPQKSDRSDADLRAHLSRLANATAPAHGLVLQEMLSLIWSVWPHPPDTQLPPADTPAGEVALLRAQLTAQAVPGDGSLAELLKAALPVLEPDAERRVYAMRTTLARLSGLTGPDVTGVRASTRAALEYQLSPDPVETHQRPAEPAPPLHTTTSVYAEDTPGEETFQVTENAGLVLLHPFYTLLFDRLKIDHDGKTLVQDHLPRALGALQFLAGDAAQNDPLHRVLLGLDAAQPLPDPETPNEDASTLMDGLLRSVIERWGRLGATSPDGLRETFIRRTGTLRFDATGARLRVTPGPFDMLLDSLPWSPGPVTLPWMPLPCYVSWREDEDA